MPQAPSIGFSGNPSQDLDSTMRVRHAQPMQGINGAPNIGNMQQAGNMQSGYGAGRQAPERANVPQPGYGGVAERGMAGANMNRSGPAPAAPQRQAVASFGGGSREARSGGMTATERRAAEIARNRQTGGVPAEQKKSGCLVPVLIALLIVLIIMAVIVFRLIL